MSFSEVRWFSKVTSVKVQGFFEGLVCVSPGRPFAMKVRALGIPHGEGRPSATGQVDGVTNARTASRTQGCDLGKSPSLSPFHHWKQLLPG